jgi:hypothetical protein
VVSISDDKTTSEDKSYLDDYTEPSKQLIKEILFNAYESEWQRTHDIEHKASSIIGFVGIIFTLTIASLSTILVGADEITRDKVFYSSIYSPIGIFLILLLMALSIYCGIRATYVKSWEVPLANKFLEYCKEETKTEKQLLEAILDDYVDNTTDNSKTNDKMAEYLKVSFILFLVSLACLIGFIMYIICSFK